MAPNNSDANRINFPPEELRKLKPIERIPFLDTVYVSSPRIQKFLDRMQACYTRVERCQARGIKVADPPCVLLTGRFGSGKSSLAMDHCLKHESAITYPSPSDMRAGKQFDIVRACIPSKPTETTLATALLHAMGDPLAKKGTGVIRTYRLYDLLLSCQVKQIVLDETQHFVDQDSSFLLNNASNWLKNLIKETGISCVLVGLQGDAELIVEANGQLADLFGSHMVLEPFRWAELPAEEREKPPAERQIASTRHEFCAFMRALDSVLPLKEPSGLAEINTAKRCFVASYGLMRPLMTLIRGATISALEKGQEHIDHQLLSESFTTWLAPEYREIRNPFTGQCPDPRELPQVERRIIKGNRPRYLNFSTELHGYNPQTPGLRD